MTGEITLRGRVLPIGGLKEKLLAARRGDIKKVIIPKENEKDLIDVPKEVTGGMLVKPVTHMDEVLTLALLDKSDTVFPGQSILIDQKVPFSDETVTAH